MNNDIIIAITFLPAIIPIILYALPVKKRGWRKTLVRYFIVIAFAVGGAFFYYHLFTNTAHTAIQVGGYAFVYYIILEIVRRIVPGGNRKKYKKSKKRMRRAVFSMIALVLVFIIAGDFILTIPFVNSIVTFIA